MSPNYKDTLHLPKTDFPMKADLVKREPERLKIWEEQGLYAQIQTARKDAPVFVLHDGTPKLVLGDALRSWSFAGYDRPEPRPTGTATLITPPSLVEVVRAGWNARRADAEEVPFLHPTVGGVD